MAVRTTPEGPGLGTILANSVITASVGRRVTAARIERMFGGDDRELLDLFVSIVSGLSPAVRGEIAELGKGHDDKDTPGFSLNQAGIDSLVNKFGSGREQAIATAALALACHAHNLLTGEVPGLEAVAARRVALLSDVEAALGVRDLGALDRLLKAADGDGNTLLDVLREVLSEGRQAAVSLPVRGEGAPDA